MSKVIYQVLMCENNSFPEYFNLRTLLRYLHFIRVTNPFIIYSHLSFPHVEPCDMAGHVSHIEGGEVLEEYLVYDLSGKERGLVSRTAAGK